MKDLTSTFWIAAKAVLFLLMALVATVLLVGEYWSLNFVLLFAVAVWSFCRLYYFAFYVIEKYIDPSYKFSGLGSFFAYLWRCRRNRK